MKITLQRYYEDNKKDKWITVAVIDSNPPGSAGGGRQPGGEPLYLAMMVGKNPTGTTHSIAISHSDQHVTMSGLWFTQDGFALAPVNNKMPSVLRLVKMITVEDPHTPDVVEQLASVVEAPTP